MRLNIDVIKPSKVSVDQTAFICRIGIKNNLDNNNVSEFEFLLTTLIRGGVKKIILDIEDLNYIDSSAIGKLIGITKAVRKLKGDIVVSRYSSEIMNVVKVIKLEKFIKFFPSIDEGVNYLKLI